MDLKKFFKTGFIFLGLGLGITYFAIQNWDSPIENPSVFQTSQKCQSPCWMGIRPGESSINDLEILINNNPEQFSKLQCVNNGARCAWWDYKEKFHGMVEIQNEVVLYIEFSPLKDIPLNQEPLITDLAPIIDAGLDLTVKPITPYDSQSSLMLKDVIEKLGVPTNYFLNQSIGFDGPPYFTYVIFFEEKKVIATIFAIPDPITMQGDDCKTDISPNMVVNDLYFGDVIPIVKSEFGRNFDKWQAWTDFDTVEPFPACW